jgi:uncharacterized protein
MGARKSSKHMNEEQPKKSKRGFASMNPERQREIARKGGKSVPAEKRSFSKNSDLAASAGRKGGQSVDPKKRSFSRDKALAAQAGAKGGHATHGGGRRKEP